MPRVTALIPAYNAASYIEEAVTSVLTQSFTDLEVIVVDDGSTDETASVLESVGDGRLRVLRQDNAGIATALNRGLALARGAYLARLDADDRCRPDRFEKQVSFLDRHPRVSAVGSYMRAIDAVGLTGRQIPALASDYFIRRDLPLRNPMHHPAVMFRTSALLQAQGWRPEWVPVEDYDLWRRIPGELANIAEPLTDYRLHPAATNRVTQAATADRLRVELRADHATGTRVPFGTRLTSLWRERHHPRFFVGRQLAQRRHRHAGPVA